MSKIVDDTITCIGEFLPHKDVFNASTINRQWRSALFYNRREIIQKVQKEVIIQHTCDNLCPCILEKYYQTMIEDFKLKRFFCNILNHKKSPPWLSTYL